MIDASDVGIIAFASGPGLTQKSQIRNNTVISAGVPAFAAIMFEPLSVAQVGGSTSFAGAAVTNNAFWSAPDSHFDFGLMIGNTPWYANPSIGNGGSVSGNTNAGIATPAYVGLLVDGMTNVSIGTNFISRVAPMVSYPDIARVYNNHCAINGSALAHMGLGHASSSASTSTTGAHACTAPRSPTARVQTGQMTSRPRTKALR